MELHAAAHVVAICLVFLLFIFISSNVLSFCRYLLALANMFEANSIKCIAHASLCLNLCYIYFAIAFAILYTYMHSSVTV